MDKHSLDLLLRVYAPLGALQNLWMQILENLREGRPAGRMCIVCQVRGRCSTPDTLEDHQEIHPAPKQVMQVQPAGQATRGWRAEQAMRGWRAGQAKR